MARLSSSHTISACPCADWRWHAAGGSALSTTRAAVALGSVQSAVPPTPVTSGSDAGQPTVGNGIVVPPFATGGFFEFAVPKSPELASTDTPFAAAFWNA